MRRAAVKAFRTARSTSLLLSTRGRTFQLASYALSIRNSSSGTKPNPSSAIPPPLQSSSSMYIRRFSLALVSGIVGYGAYYYGTAPNTTVTAPFSTSTVQEARAKSPSYDPIAPQETASEAERKVLVVGPDTLYTAAVDGPISKDTDESGRKVLEMLTPEQATQKLRRNEESYLIGRGKGVVRYDVVQIPSNDPIEDDHAEKIIEIPQAAENPTSDWMFWGVFDGHA